jgi:hypothetical protein
MQQQWPRAVEERLRGLELNVGTLRAAATAGGTAAIPSPAPRQGGDQGGPSPPGGSTGPASALSSDRCVLLLEEIARLLRSHAANAAGVAVPGAPRAGARAGQGADNERGLGDEPGCSLVGRGPVWFPA